MRTGEGFRPLAQPQTTEANEEQTLLQAPLPPLPPDQGAREELEFFAPKGSTLEEAWIERIRVHRENVAQDWTPAGVTGDAYNIWTTNMMKVDIGQFNTLRPLRSYGEYIQKKYGFDPATVEYIMRKTGAEKIRTIDSLADEFNSNLESIRAGDKELANDFFERAKVLFRG